MFRLIFYLFLRIKFVVKMIFNDNGTLNPGIHKMTWKEFNNSFSFSPRRKELLVGLEKVLLILKEIDAKVYIDGSFVTDKLEPGDWDACFDCSKDKLDELKTKYPLHDRKLQKYLYKGELFCAQSEADEYGATFLEFFQQIRGSSNKKGIIEMIL